MKIRPILKTVVVMVALMIGCAQTAGAQSANVVPQSPITTQYDSARGFPDRNGPLSAMLIVIPQAELVEFTKPADGGRNLSRVARAEPGAVLAFKVLFTGVERDILSMTNVTYDLQVYDPTGRIYGQSDYHNLVALIAQPDAGTLLFDNGPQVVMLEFEPQDPIGIYVVKVLLRDNVSGRTLPLEARVELLPLGQNAAITAPSVAVASPAPAVTVQPGEGPRPYLEVKAEEEAAAAAAARAAPPRRTTARPATPAPAKPAAPAKPRLRLRTG